MAVAGGTGRSAARCRCVVVAARAAPGGHEGSDRGLNQSDELRCIPESQRVVVATRRRGEIMAHVIVAGHVMVEAAERVDYLKTCVEVVRQARAAAGCVDFAISA